MKLQDYIQGERRGKDANALERDSLNDPFLEDAIDGFDAVEGEHWPAIEALEKLVTARTNKNHSPHLERWFIVRIAASFILLIGMGALLYWNLGKSEQSIVMNMQTHEKALPEQREPQEAIAEEKEKIQEPMLEKAPLPAMQKPVKMPITPDIMQDMIADESAKISEEEIALFDMEIDDVKISKEISIDETTIVTQEVEKETADELMALGARKDKHSEKNISENVKEAEAYIVNKQESAQNVVAFEKAEKASDIDSLNFGEKEFKAYFEEHRKKDICKGKLAFVRLQFEINNAGKPVHIKISEKSCQEMAKEAVKLLENGPRWTVAPSKINLELKIE